MSRIKKICNFMSSNIAVLIIVFSVIAFFYPKGFSWATNYTTLFLGAAMFGMGLTIKTEDFKIVFTRPRDLCIGFILQYTVMPLTAFALAKLFALPADLALGVILVGCCPGGTASNVITYVADGDVPLSVGMTIVSTILAPICTPVLVYLLGGGIACYHDDVRGKGGSDPGSSGDSDLPDFPKTDRRPSGSASADFRDCHCDDYFGDRGK